MSDKPSTFVRLSVSVEPETYEALLTKAREDKRTISSMVNWILAEWLKLKGSQNA